MSHIPFLRPDFRLLLFWRVVRCTHALCPTGRARVVKQLTMLRTRFHLFQSLHVFVVRGRKPPTDDYWYVGSTRYIIDDRRAIVASGTEVNVSVEPYWRTKGKEKRIEIHRRSFSGNVVLQNCSFIKGDFIKNMLSHFRKLRIQRLSHDRIKILGAVVVQQ